MADRKARERLDLDLLVVGGGPAGLATAIRLAQLRRSAGLEALSIGVIEKGREVGAHTLSGAILDPSTIARLIPDFRERAAALLCPVRKDHVYYLTRTRKFELPLIPPPLRNHGHYVVSLSALVGWMSQHAEAAGVDVFTGFAGQEPLVEDGRVVGVRTGVRGLAKDGTEKPNFEPGVDIHAKVTIFCDGVRGNLTKRLIRDLGLGRTRHPQQYALGIKELWEVSASRLEPGTVVHTMGYPLGQDEFGGGFVYGLPDGKIAIGLVCGLDYRNPQFDPHAAFNAFKQHPLIADLLASGTLVRYGAKAIPEGGWNTIPRLYMDGGLIAGDAGAFVNSLRLKGIHLAIATGMLAAETAFEAIQGGDTSAARLRTYEQRLDASPVRAELYPVRNVHQAFGWGLIPGALFAGVTTMTGGRGQGHLSGRAGHERLEKRAEVSRAEDDGVPAVSPDRKLTFDKLTDVHFSGTSHHEDQPNHLQVQTDVCRTVCGPEYGHPCVRFCPANVYEIGVDANGRPSLHINASNCVHCKTCDIFDPYQAINWVPPEGGGGPGYSGM